MKNLKTILIAVVIIAAISFKVYNRTGRKPNVEKILVEQANKINKTLPKMIDENTRLDSTKFGPGKFFVYNYTLIGIDLKDFDIEGFKKAVTPKIQDFYNNNPSIKGVKDNKIALKYNYYTPDKKLICEITIK